VNRNWQLQLATGNWQLVVCWSRRISYVISARIAVCHLSFATCHLPVATFQLAACHLPLPLPLATWRLH